MTEPNATLWASFVGAVTGSVFSLVGLFAGSWLTQGRERRQQIWQTEISRMISLEERAGQAVELIGSYQSIEAITEGAKQWLPSLEFDAGRFRRHKPVMQAIRDLHNGLSRLLREKQRGEDSRKTSNEVEVLYLALLAECDRVTGKRRI
jgi:hypothetical protein